MYKTLQKYFGYTEFRPLQKEIIDDVIAGKDTFVLMPTGGGKSLCYQLPALLTDGLTVVVSPLISLMKDQVDSLKANGIAAAYLNSTLGYREIHEINNDLLNNRIKILYVAPERLMMSSTLELFKNSNVNLFAIDEAHCISEWGHDFRPEYRRLDMLKAKFPNAAMIALTATATPKVQEDIISHLKLVDYKSYIASFDRRNLVYQVRPKKDTYNQLIKYLIKHVGECGIIYCQSRSTVDRLSSRLKLDGFDALPYHAGLSDSKRRKNQEDFIKDNAEIIVATIAFGMGIDKPNVRFVIHYDLPKNLESYYQETGRGGRDGLECECLLFFSRGDRYKIEYFINQKQSKEERDVALYQLREMVNYCDSNMCRRKVLLNYFGEEYDEQNCGKCDACLEPKEKFEGTEAAIKLLNCVDDLNQRFGMNYVIDVLIGSKTKKIIGNKHNLLKSYGSGHEFSKAHWQSIAREMISLDLLMVEGERYPLLKLNQKSRDLLTGSETVRLTKPAVDVQIARKQATTPFTDHDMLERLKKLRKTIADKENVPPYIVFADTSLRQMATKLPKTRDDLLQITGVGEHKSNKYGDIFLKEIAGNSEKHDDSSSPIFNNTTKISSPVIPKKNKLKG
ncbi:MAG: DNA helicase RecQ [Methanosarcinaceae archaeon]|nr:DNA helicase RecQ [Methanosarcinaceae archaeon]